MSAAKTAQRRRRQMRNDKRYRPQNTAGVNGYAAGKVLPAKKAKGKK